MILQDESIMYCYNTITGPGAVEAVPQCFPNSYFGSDVSVYIAQQIIEVVIRIIIYYFSCNLVLWVKGFYL